MGESKALAKVVFTSPECHSIKLVNVSSEVKTRSKSYMTNQTKNKRILGDLGNHCIIFELKSL